MSYTTELFHKDLKTVKEALKKMDFIKLNMYCNRIMSNAYILQTPEPALCGLIIKDVSFMISPLKELSDSRPLSVSIQIIENLVKKIEEMKPESFSPDLWSQFNSQLGLLRKNLLDSNEKDVFVEERKNVTRECFLRLIEFIEKNKDILKSPDCRIFDAIMVEMTRIYTSYGIEIEETKIRSICFALELIYDYAKRDAKDLSVYETNVEELVYPFVDRAITLIKNNQLNDKNADNLITDIVFCWRELFLRYSEPFRVQTQREFEYNKVQSPIVFPTETKDKLADLVTRSIEDQIRKEK